MQCPQCDQPLEKKLVSGIEVPVCENCQGFWLEGIDIVPFFDELKTDASICTKPKTGEAAQIITEPGFCSTCNFVLSFVHIPGCSDTLMQCTQCGGVWIPSSMVPALFKLYKTNVKFRKLLLDVPQDLKTFEWRDNNNTQFNDFSLDDNPTRS